ncbi:TIGR03621 family F420-dependent LLM class oxidoreductase [Amycolatopsis jiangsuensis]|uniref:Putative F420-dependent oxidoreductase n=1 Tax=Amycolatopsis jiangsuensis TaxID=1181879 RepID=A0A840IXH2_9PSEU|nr:TIGR03621 family F420-dependent LLM class oxidoreductase [Amycolatopsis jiangsuensis]MBB4687336.1 putative F420-dependent oxidoreductase [Amycolatopsis jiangsuensis]
MTISRPWPFRFGVNLVLPDTREDCVAKCRRIEELGYDVLCAADHLGMQPPFPALVLAGAVTERIRLGTFVLNTPFYNPVLLAREVAGTDQLVGGRLELGLGAGYVKDEFDAAGISFPRARERVDHLERTITELERLYADAGYEPKPAQPGGPPLLMAGSGDRSLTLAAEHAAIIGFTGTGKFADGAPLVPATAEHVEERTRFVSARLGARAAEFNLLVHFPQVTEDRRRALDELHERIGGALTAEQLASTPAVLAGTADEIAEQLLAHRARFGISYYTVLEEHAESFAPVLKALHGR